METTMAVAKNPEYNAVYLIELELDGAKYLKPGYSANVDKRMKSIQYSYHSAPKLLRVYRVNSECDEKRFHSMLQSKYPALHHDLIIGGKPRTELYSCDDIIKTEFDNYFRENSAQKECPNCAVLRFEIAALHRRLALRTIHSGEPC